MGFYGNPSGGFGMPKMIEIVDGAGNTLIGTVTDSEIDLDATREDVKIGKTFAANDGIQEGTDTKTYRTIQSSRLILPGLDFSIPLSEYEMYNYTKFQCIIAKFNTSFDNSVETNKVVINNNVYQINSTEVLSQITKNDNTKSIDLNIINNTEDSYVIHYSTYKEE